MEALSVCAANCRPASAPRLDSPAHLQAARVLTCLTRDSAGVADAPTTREGGSIPVPTQLSRGAPPPSPLQELRAYAWVHQQQQQQQQQQEEEEEEE